MPEPSLGNHLDRFDQITSLFNLTETRLTAMINRHTGPRVEEHAHIRRGANRRGIQVSPKSRIASLLLVWRSLCPRLALSNMSLLIEYEDQRFFFRLTKPGPHRSYLGCALAQFVHHGLDVGCMTSCQVQVGNSDARTANIRTGPRRCDSINVMAAQTGVNDTSGLEGTHGRVNIDRFAS